MTKRNTSFVVSESLKHYRLARNKGLVHNHIHSRQGKSLVLDNNINVIDFINCSYLGLDTHPEVIAAYNSSPNNLGANFCCARTRLTDYSLKHLEERLRELFRGRVVTFPSVTATHMSVMPLIASGVLINPDHPPAMHLIFDRFAHASMQFLIPILEKECRISVIEHNNLDELMHQVSESRNLGETVVYVADGIYSMGGACPIADLLALAEQEEFFLYIDDAHGTSILGNNGEGPVLSQIKGTIPPNLFVTFSMTKGFGVAGGGIVISHPLQEELIRTYGMVYAFSAPLDFSSTRAAHAALNLHFNGVVSTRQKTLRQKVELFDRLMGRSEAFSPIRMIRIGLERDAIEIAASLLRRGFLTVVAFFPVVSRGNAQLRICLSTEHSDEQIIQLTENIRQLMTEQRDLKMKGQDRAV